MPFVSYAQNFEDVMLWRCFRDRPNGFYIDVGAQDPEMDSVTKAFYDRGWSGVNIEPTQQYFEELKQNRSRDVNLQVACGATNGRLKLYLFAGTGLTTAIHDFAQKNIESGYIATHIDVPMKTLAEICATYATVDIDFMKIDVEGYELEVLQGADFSIYRPKIILIEATKPNTQIESFREWEKILLSERYVHVYSDGLNRFYVAQEYISLQENFKYPPNVFDNFLSSREVFLENSSVVHRDTNHQEVELLGSNGTIQNKPGKYSSFDFSMLQADEVRRVKMTVSCADSSAIPKVAHGGQMGVDNFGPYQIMHNGIRITKDCYYGPWMTKIIEILRGHHDPQEEWAFFKILERMKLEDGVLQHVVSKGIPFRSSCFG